MHYERKGFATIAKMRLQLVFLCVVDLRTLKLLSRLILYWKCYCTCTDSDFSDCIHLSLSWGINEWRWLSCIIPSLLDVWNTNKNIGLKILQSSRKDWNLCKKIYTEITTFLLYRTIGLEKFEKKRMQQTIVFVVHSVHSRSIQD